MKANFADNLKKIRKESGLSQEELADKLGVSRQSISKWESSQAYPEMDKVLQLCNIFNLKVDELLNQDIKDVKDRQESRNKVNKYIDDFLKFITKSIDMFSAMTFKEKIKCLFEQFVIILILLFVYTVLGGILEWVLSGIFGVLPSNIYSVIYRIFEIIYGIIYLVFGFVIFIHVFKTRYLDYYEIIREDDTPDDVQDDDKNDKKIQVKDKEKIIIRDPKHAEYRFINGLLKIAFFIFKCFTGIIFAMISIFLIFLVFNTALFIYHIFVHFIFVGLTICGIAGITVTILILLLLFGFIFNRKNNIKRIFAIFIIALVLGGVGMALTFTSFINMKYKDVIYENTDSLVKTYKYDNNINIVSYLNDYTFMVDNSLADKIKFEVKYNKDINTVRFSKNGNDVSLHYDNNVDNVFTFYKKLVSGLKENTIYSYVYDEPSTVIITSEDNIKKMISKLSDGNVTKFSTDGNKYYLSMEYDYDGDAVCYLENDYYHKCVSVDADDIDISEFSYDKDGLHYDSNKYICEGNDNKYCYEKDDD